MNIKVLSACGLSLALLSCTAFDPEYAQYKKDKKANAETGASYGGAGDPYSNVSNPYGVPGQPPQGRGETGQYNANPSTPPYQPLPGVPSSPNAYPTIPSNNPANAPVTVQTHVVVKGDSLWGLSKQYGSSADAIRQANGLSNDVIRLGQTLQIPR